MRLAMLKELVCTFFIIISLSLFAQKDSTSHRLYGVPYMTHYEPSDYNAHRQNWAIIQDEKGIIYVGNSSGLLTFDGITWRLYETPNKTTVRSLGKDPNGRIYYGAQGDFGYLDNDHTGELKFMSLTNSLPKLSNELKDIWSIHYFEGRVYVQSLGHILSFNPDEIEGDSVATTLNYESIDTKEEVNGVSIIDNDLYFWVYRKGIMTFENDEAKPIYGGKGILQKEVLRVLPFQNSDELFICTLSNGFFAYDGTAVRRHIVSEKLENLLATNRIYDIQRLSDGTLALSTNKAGLLIINEQGQILQEINKSLGLLSNNILGSYIDSQGGLWLATSQGVSRIETPSPLQCFGVESQLEGRVKDFKVHKGELYIASNLGVYKMASDSVSTRFQKVSDITDNVFSLESNGDKLMAAFPYLGTFEFENNEALKIIDKEVPVKVKASRFDPNIVFIGSGGNSYGFAILRKVENKWEPIYVYPKVKEQIREIEEEAPGVVWLGTRNNGYLRLEIPDLKSGSLDQGQINSQDTLQIIQQRYTKQDTTTVFRSRLYYINNKVEFATSVGLRKIDSITGQLVLDDRLHPRLADTTVTVNIIREAIDKSLWIYTNATENSIVKLVPENDQYTWQEVPELNRTIGTTFISLFSDPHNTDRLYLGKLDGLITYNSKIKRPYGAKYHALIRQVLIEEDSLVYSGNWLDDQKIRQPDTYNYSRKAISFSYASTSYDMPEKTQYQYALEGYDDNWSDWSVKNKKEYTNLPGGDYTFKVRAKNIYGIESEIGEFAFSIKPPWYLSFVAYMMYSISVVAGFLLILLYRENIMRKRQRIELTKMENKLLKTEIEYKKKDLSDFAINISQNQQWNNYLLSKMEEIKEAKGRKKGAALVDLEREIKEKNNVMASNINFQKRIDVLSNEFYNSLLQRYPDLSKTELKLCSLIRLSLDNHDIATLQNVDISSVYTSRYRLRKKLNMTSDTDLDAFLKGF
ncbi:triple tyrosine motif-containing protein [Winogradskyella sp. 3972H.M.0a.05]|uniref:triple tyrosine motif-containing protein n=1 Tax=Winogradskyella sp. 3972H.M.0a.05 TaxID=2950277 RepID=UPI003396ACE0